jgi:hypothetical protein
MMFEIIGYEAGEQYGKQAEVDPESWTGGGGILS